MTDFLHKLSAGCQTQALCSHNVWLGFTVNIQRSGVCSYTHYVPKADVGLPVLQNFPHKRTDSRPSFPVCLSFFRRGHTIRSSTVFASSVSWPLRFPSPCCTWRICPSHNIPLARRVMIMQRFSLACAPGRLPMSSPWASLWCAGWWQQTHHR